MADKKPRKSTPKVVQLPFKKRKVSFAGARQKGSRFESEVVEILKSKGIPTQKVLASGAYSGASSDLKVGVELNEDGSYPQQDEGKCKLRGECKAHATNPERLHTDLSKEPFALVAAEKELAEQCWNFYNQDSCSRAVFLRRAKVPTGAIKNEDWNQVIGVFMGISDFAALLRRAYYE
jgi:hypothetical protein